MDQGDNVAGERSPQQDCALAGAAPTELQPVHCGAMMQQRNGHGLQSWPQQFIRLVGGGGRRPAPVERAPVGN